MSIDAEAGVNRNGYLEILWRFNPEALEFIEGLGESLSYSAQQQIVAQGEDGSAMYLILEGSVSIVKQDSGEQKILARLDRLRSFGEVAMLTQSPRSASVMAESDVRVLRISRENLQKLSQDNPRLALQIYRILAESLAKSLTAK